MTVPTRSSASPSLSPALPVLAVVAGIAAFSAMDAAMKGASLALGVYSALAWRNALGTLCALPVWIWGDPTGHPRLPPWSRLRLHAFRAAITTFMAALFFYGLVRIPMAEGIAISFIAPIIALFLAALLLGERIRPRALLASIMGIFGVLVIASGRLEALDSSAETWKGIAAVLCSALFYALNLVLQRKQALLAGPREITLFQNLFATLFIAIPAPFFLMLPSAHGWFLTALAALLATLAHLLLSWGYARAETQVLVPVEYTGFVWAALSGWLFFQENVTLSTILGAVLIIAGCWLGTRNKVAQEPSRRFAETPPP